VPIGQRAQQDKVLMEDIKDISKKVARHMEHDELKKS